MDRSARAGDRERRSRHRQDRVKGCGAKIRLDGRLESSCPDAGKVLVVSQRYRRASSSTAAIMAAIAHWLAGEAEVTVISGYPGSASAAEVGRPAVVEIRNWMPGKSALIKRVIAVAISQSAFLSRC